MSSCKDKLRNLDFFGAPIGLTFNSDYNFKTTPGGFCTLLIILICSGNFFTSIYNFYSGNPY